MWSGPRAIREIYQNLWYPEDCWEKAESLDTKHAWKMWSVPVVSADLMEDLAECNNILKNKPKHWIMLLNLRNAFSTGDEASPKNLPSHRTIVSVCAIGMCGSVTSAFFNQSWNGRGVGPHLLKSCACFQLWSRGAFILKHSIICSWVVGWGNFFPLLAPVWGAGPFYHIKIMLLTEVGFFFNLFWANLQITENNPVITKLTQNKWNMKSSI